MEVKRKIQSGGFGCVEWGYGMRGIFKVPEASKEAHPCKCLSAT